jgi:APA family basic amino acid/polyamine antiporter
VTYDGWYGSIYLAEETTAPAKNLPRALILCTIGVTLLYVLINVGFMHALSIPQLAASKLPAADAAKAILPAGSALFVQVVSLLTVLGLVNVTVLGAPRVLFGVTRDSQFARHTTQVSRGGTPRVALLLTTAAATLLILTGTFNQVIALAAVLFVVNYLSAYVAVFRLRRKEPQLARPYRAVGYPWTTGVAIVGSIGILLTVIGGDPRSAVFAAVLLALSVPVRWWIHRRSP